MPTPLHLIGHHAARRFLNFKLGYQLLRDPRVAMAKKGTALSIGAAITILLIALEVPLEAVLGFIAPFVGFFGDAVVDGAELLILPFLIAIALLPYLVRSPEELQLARVQAADPVTPY